MAAPTLNYIDDRRMNGRSKRSWKRARTGWYVPRRRRRRRETFHYEVGRELVAPIISSSSERVAKMTSEGRGREEEDEEKQEWRCMGVFKFLRVF